MYAPLSMMAPRYRPVPIVVDARRLETLKPPADSPPTVHGGRLLKRSLSKLCVHKQCSYAFRSRQNRPIGAASVVGYRSSAFT